MLGLAMGLVTATSVAALLQGAGAGMELAGGPPAPRIDPACLAATAWAVDPTDAPIRVFGCRPPADIPAPDPDGFVTYTRPEVDGLDGGFTRAKALPGAPAGMISFMVQDNTGGSFTGQSTVTGVVGADGVMQSDGLSVE